MKNQISIDNEPKIVLYNNIVLGKFAPQYHGGTKAYASVGVLCRGTG